MTLRQLLIQLTALDAGLKTEVRVVRPFNVEMEPGDDRGIGEIEIVGDIVLISVNNDRR